MLRVAFPVNIHAGNAVTPPVKLEGEGLSLEVVKKAEKEDCIIIRIVETYGRHSSGRLTFNYPVTSLIESNLLEWSNEKEIKIKGSLDIYLTPFEIRTYKVKSG